MAAETEQCPVCWEDVPEAANPAQMRQLACSHALCTLCADELFRGSRGTLCPLCRAPFLWEDTLAWGSYAAVLFELHRLEAVADAVTAMPELVLQRMFGAIGDFAACLEVRELGCLVVCKASQARANQAPIVRAGGLQLLYTSMDAADEPGTAMVCCAALSRLVRFESADEDANRLEILSTGGVSNIVAAMDRWVGEVIVLEWALTALINLSVSRELQAAIMESNAVPRVLSAMDTFAFSSNIPRFGNWLLANLATTYQLLVLAAGSLERVYGSMDVWVGDHDVQGFGCMALAAFVAEENAEALVNSGALDRVLAAAGPGACTVTRKHACIFLLQLSDVPAGKEAMLTVPAMHETVQSLKDSDPSLTLFVDEILFNLQA